ncbi:MAG: phosphotransferase [Asgard group archaeon]|nr:phosphotransferase [Asgard group archaeon]
MYEFNSDNLSFVGGFQNEIYSFQKNIEEYILRIGDSEHMTHNLVRAEMDWNVYLAENNVPAIRPTQSNNGRLVEKIEKDSGYFNAVVFEKAEGEHLNDSDLLNWSDELLINYGKIIGRMHALAKKFEPLESKRFEFQCSVDIPHLLKDDDTETVKRARKILLEAENLPKHKDSYGLVHGDLHTHNFFVKNDKITAIIDFEYSCYKWFISDISVALYYVLYWKPQLNQDILKKIAKRFLLLFMKGYETENKLNANCMEKIDLFIKVREVILLMYIPRHHEYRESRVNRLKEDNYINIQEILEEL